MDDIYGINQSTSTFKSHPMPQEQVTKLLFALTVDASLNVS